MTQMQCRKVQEWLTQSAASAGPPAAICSHIVKCARCRGALMLVVAIGLDVPVGHLITCAQCQDTLAAYVDAMVEHGEPQASAQYPDVWWHRWMCADCADIAELLYELATGTPNDEA